MNKLTHLAIIMDGNGRWAKAKGMSRSKGHERGAEVVRDITTYVAKHTNIEYLTLYAFSTENWKRPKLEVEFLMKLLEKYLKSELPVYLENNIKFENIGDISKFSKQLQTQIQITKDKTSKCTGLTHVLAINYGSQDEITRAVNKLLKSDKKEVTSQDIQNALDIKTPVDLLIRTSLDGRISNFLLWQLAYAQIEFCDTLWPDFTPQKLQTILDNFNSSKRTYGGL